MARRIINQTPAAEVGDENADTLPDGAIVTPEAVPVAPAPLKLDRDPEELAKLPAPKLYRVAMAKQVLYGGVPTVLRAGKTVSDATHDLHTLRAQGVVLEEVPHGR
jgi:hypothetical protein